MDPKCYNLIEFSADFLKARLAFLPHTTNQSLDERPLKYLEKGPNVVLLKRVSEESCGLEPLPVQALWLLGQGAVRAAGTCLQEGHSGL